jgi:hypothetical protein
VAVKVGPRRLVRQRLHGHAPLAFEVMEPPQLEIAELRTDHCQRHEKFRSELVCLPLQVRGDLHRVQHKVAKFMGEGGRTLTQGSTAG